MKFITNKKIVRKSGRPLHYYIVILFCMSLLTPLGGELRAQGTSYNNMIRGSGTTNVASSTAFTGMGAQGAGVIIMISGVQCFRTDAGTSTSYVTLNDSASTPVPLPVGSGAAPVYFSVPLQLAANTGATFTPHDALTSVICSAQGFTR